MKAFIGAVPFTGVAMVRSGRRGCTAAAGGRKNTAGFGGAATARGRTRELPGRAAGEAAMRSGATTGPVGRGGTGAGAATGVPSRGGARAGAASFGGAITRLGTNGDGAGNGAVLRDTAGGGGQGCCASGVSSQFPAQPQPAGVAVCIAKKIDGARAGEARVLAGAVNLTGSGGLGTAGMRPAVVITPRKVAAPRVVAGGDTRVGAAAIRAGAVMAIEVGDRTGTGRGDALSSDGGLGVNAPRRADETADGTGSVNAFRGVTGNVSAPAKNG